MKMYSPVAPLCTSRVACVASLMSETVAAATEAPLGSLTVPRIRPPVLCAPANGAAKRIAGARNIRETMLQRRSVLLRQNPAASFMNSPLVSKNSFGGEFFEVAVPPKPYYNPANLEKAGSRVKRKEFLQAISKSSSTSPSAHQRSGAPRRHFLLRLARLGSARPRFSTSNRKPIPSLRRSRRSPAAACRFSAPCPRTESRGHRARPKTPRCGFGAGGELSSSRPALPATAYSAWPVPRAGGAGDEGFGRLSQCARTRANALLDFHAAPHCAFLSHENPLA